MSTPLAELCARAHAARDPDLLCQVVPYARFLGITAHLVEPDTAEQGPVTCRMPFAEHLVGNRSVPALHGGSLGSLLETTAQLNALWLVDPATRPKVITLTIDYLRPAFLEETTGTVTVLRKGRRIMTVLARASQGERLVSAAKVQLMVG